MEGGGEELGAGRKWMGIQEALIQELQEIESCLRRTSFIEVVSM